MWRKSTEKIINKPILYLKNIKKLPFYIRINGLFIKIKTDVSIRYSVILSLSMLTIAGYFSTLEIDFHHQGYMLRISNDFANGKVMFKEVQNHYGFLTSFIQALFIKLFYPSVYIINLSTAIFYSLTVFFIHRISIRVMPFFLANLTCILWIILAPFYVLPFHPWSSVYALFFQILSIFFMIKFLEEKNDRNIFLTGFSVFFCFLCKQSIGIMQFLAIFIFIIIYFKELNYLRLYLISFFIPLLFFFMYLFITLSFNDWYVQNIKFLFSFASIGVSNESTIWGKCLLLIKKLFPNIKFYFKSRKIFTIMPIINIILFTFMFYQYLFRKKFINNYSIILLLCLSSLFSWHQYYPIPCLRHVYWASTPMIVILPFSIHALLSQFIRQNKYLIIFFTLFALVVISYGDIRSRYKYGLKRIRKFNNEITNISYMQHMRVDPQTLVFINEYNEAINQLLKNRKVSILMFDKNILNDLYLLLTAANNNNDNINSIFCDEPYETQLIEQNYDSLRDNYVNRQKPIILSIQEKLPYEDYVIFKKFKNHKIKIWCHYDQIP